jgi:hypothetical protein
MKQVEKHDETLSWFYHLSPRVVSLRRCVGSNTQRLAKMNVISKILKVLAVMTGIALFWLAVIVLSWLGYVPA